MDPLRERLEALSVGRAAPTPLGGLGSATRPTIAGLAESVGGSAIERDGAGCWFVERLATDLCDETARELAELPTVLALHDAKPASITLDLADTLVLDIETGGFVGTPVFLIGVIRPDLRPLRIEQWLVRDYPDEAGVLGQLAAVAADRRTWVTFNGRTFDAPFVADRAALHRVALAMPREHVDLLHIARRRYRRTLADCRLETLERAVLGRERIGDVPGRDTPDLFHHFIRTGNARPLRGVVEHNQRDLLTSLALLARFSREPLAAEPDAPAGSAEPTDGTLWGIS